MTTRAKHHGRPRNGPRKAHGNRDHGTMVEVDANGAVPHTMILRSEADGSGNHGTGNGE